MTPFGCQDILTLVMHMSNMSVDVLDGNPIPGFLSSLLKLIQTCWSMGSSPNSFLEGVPNRLDGVEVRGRGRMRENLNAIVTEPVPSRLGSVGSSTVLLECDHPSLSCLLPIEII